MKNLLLTLLLLLPLHAEAQLMKTGPEYMPAEMEPVTAPFDVSGISRPVFADRTRTVKMNKRGLSTRQIQTAIDRMSRQGGGTVIVPDGQWTSGRIELKSGVCLHLSDGAMLTFSGYIKDYQPAVPTRNEGYDVMSLGAMIYANGAENIGLTGRGHIVGPSTDCEIYQENRKYLVVEECVDVTKPIAAAHDGGTRTLQERADRGHHHRPGAVLEHRAAVLQQRHHTRRDCQQCWTRSY